MTVIIIPQAKQFIQCRNLRLGRRGFVVQRIGRRDQFLGSLEPILLHVLSTPLQTRDVLKHYIDALVHIFRVTSRICDEGAEYFPRMSRENVGVGIVYQAAPPQDLKYVTRWISKPRAHRVRHGQWKVLGLPDDALRIEPDD